MPDVSREIVLDGSKPEEVEDKDKREIGGDAVWTLSTAKPGNGVEQLRYIDLFRCIARLCTLPYEPCPSLKRDSVLDLDLRACLLDRCAGTTTPTRIGSLMDRSRTWSTSSFTRRYHVRSY